jgi:hypothetical protein
LAERGTSVEQMGKDFGAQLDQAYLRAEQFRPEVRESQVLDAQHSGAAIPSYGMHPYGMDFYSTGEPRKVIDESAKELGIPQPVHAVMNSLTSPQTKFQQIHKTGEVSYPNNDVAMHAVRHAQAGGTYEDVSNQITGTEKRHQGFKTNLRKAVRATEQHMEGVSPSDWRGVPSKSNPEGSSLWENAPKTGPYANSFSDTHPQFVVGDVHTGGGGGVPHLSSDKPVLRDAEGNPRLNKEGREIRDKSEREKAIADVPFYHSAMDYAVRQEMIKRNLGSVRDTQGAEWGEEQLSRNLKSGPKEHQVYKRQDVFHQQAQQGKLF